MDKMTDSRAADAQAQGGWEVGCISGEPQRVQQFGEPVYYLYTVLVEGVPNPLLIPGTKIYTAPPSAPVGVEAPADEFSGDTPHLIRCIESLLRLDAAGALVPHGVGGHARTMLAAAAKRLAQQPASDGGFTAADMMDARQEGLKEAQQPAAGVTHADHVRGLADILAPEKQADTLRAAADAMRGQQPAAVDEAMVERIVDAIVSDPMNNTDSETLRVCVSAALAAQPRGSDNDR